MIFFFLFPKKIKRSKTQTFACVSMSTTKKRLKRLAVFAASTALPLAAGYYVGNRIANKKLKNREGELIAERNNRNIAEHIQNQARARLEGQLDDAQELFEMQIDAAQRNQNNLARENKGLLLENAKQQEIIGKIVEEHNANKDLIGTHEQRLRAVREEALHEGSRMGYLQGHRHRQAEVNYYRQRTRQYRDSTHEHVLAEGEPKPKVARGRLKRIATTIGKVAKKVAMVAGPIVATKIAFDIGNSWGHRNGKLAAADQYDRKLGMIQEKLKRKLHKDRDLHYKRGVIEEHLRVRPIVRAAYDQYKTGFHAGQEFGREQHRLNSAMNPHYWPVNQAIAFDQIGPDDAPIQPLPSDIPTMLNQSARGRIRRKKRRVLTEPAKLGSGLYSAHRPYSTDSYKPGIADHAGMLFQGYTAYKDHQRRQKLREQMARKLEVDPEDLDEMFAREQ